MIVDEPHNVVLSFWAGVDYMEAFVVSIPILYPCDACPLSPMNLINAHILSI